MLKQLLKTFVAVLAIAAAATGPVRAQSNPTKYTSAVAMSALQVGDTLAEGFSLTGNESNLIYLVANRHKHNENLSSFLESINLDWIQSIGANCVFSTLVNEQSITFAPVDENGQDCDAWVVTEVESIEGFTNITIAGIRIPGPLYTVKMAPGTVDSVKWVFNPSAAVDPGVAEGTVVNISYTGNRKVKEIKATVDGAVSLSTPLTIEALTDGTVVLQMFVGMGTAPTFQYSVNGDARQTYNGSAQTINVTAGDKIQFFGNNSKYDGTNITGGTADVKVYGNIMSLVDENGFATATTLTANDAFSSLFVGYAHLKDISGLLLPATTLSQNCYSSMFTGCTGLTTVPSNLLPATTLARGCYVGMFVGCQNLTNVPTLPATTLAELCYNNMFFACTGLTTVPTDLLPATTLAQYCYSNMFRGCTSLTTAPALPATTMQEDCYYNMFYGCTSLTAAPALPATNLAPYCYFNMFYNCTGLTDAPALPATTLAHYCYKQMFTGCTNLTTSPVLPATTLIDYCYEGMFKNCSNLASVTCLATNISATNCIRYWLDGAGSDVQGTKTFYKAASMSGWGTNIPDGWTVENAPNN